ncbi:MAG: ACP S-malonyltransferase [Candidatus Competibacterales bacterium]|nr:ACP S-malonyltransferase [Candidatus Competibacterales bacterium]
MTPQLMFVFPGQGAQYAGIGSDLYREYASARQIYDRAGETLGYDIAELSFTGPEETLKLTRHTQPVLLTHHIACLSVFRELTEDRVQPDIAAGHSLGEYSALMATGVLDFEDALRLVRKRGELMGELGAGEMAALPLPLDEAGPLAEKHYCAVAGLNLRDQTVVGGLPEDLDRLEAELAETQPRKRPVRLKTEGAFHTYYMVGAAREYRSVLEGVRFSEGRGRILSNYTGGFHDLDPAAIRTRLFFQLFHPVRWLDNLHAAMGAGVNRIIEFGGGIGKGESPADKRPNLESMIKKVQRGAEHPIDYLPAINLETIAAAADVLRG